MKPEGADADKAAREFVQAIDHALRDYINDPMNWHQLAAAPQVPLPGWFWPEQTNPAPSASVDYARREARALASRAWQDAIHGEHSSSLPTFGPEFDFDTYVGNNPDNPATHLILRVAAAAADVAHAAAVARYGSHLHGLPRVLGLLDKLRVREVAERRHAAGESWDEAFRGLAVSRATGFRAIREGRVKRRR